MPVIGGKRLYNDPKDPRNMSLAEIQKKIAARKAQIDRFQGTATPATMAKLTGGLARLQTQANTTAYQGYRGIPTQGAAEAARAATVAVQRAQDRVPQVIHVNLVVDGKTIAHAVARAGTRKKATH